MADYNLEALFGLKDKVAVVTGGGGVLCGEMSKAIAAVGAKVAVLDLRQEAAQAVADEITKSGGTAIGVECNVLEIDSIKKAKDAVVAEYGKVDILVNGAGGNHKSATTGGTTIADQLDPTFFDLDSEGFQFVFNLNFLGTLLPTQVFAKEMTERKAGNIINVSSMNAFCPLTKIPAYSAAKAAVTNFTQWLAVHFAPANVRVNAIAPGFFLTDQNRFLLTDEKTGDLTPRGQLIVDNTPMGKFGSPDQLMSTLMYLIGDGADFVTGITVPVDGGFASFSGV
ncbi:MAG: SDR family oxidoreductase [Planctomycetota bacterium]|jgi:NAD(P)-dependent dehydrogenase (short-subunit alcohol dehydrogenase family)